MWRLTLLVIAFVGVVLANDNSTTKVFRIRPENNEQLEFLRVFDDDDESGWSFWKEPTVISEAVDLMVSPSNQSNFTSLMNSRGIAYETWIDNVEQLLKKTNHKLSRRGLKKVFDWTRYHNLDEIYNWLDTLATEFPKIVKLVVAGTTHEGRKIRGVKLTFGKAAKRQGIFIEGGIHAREWISPATVTYLLDQLLRSKEPQVRDLAESHDWYIFPVFNPDGYAYTHTDPTNKDVRMWRKNRSPNPQSKCLGTDMNRNWAFKWNTNGASNNPCSIKYAGPKPFSTVETQTLSSFIDFISDELFAYISFHSYSQLLMFPYGHTKGHLDNYNDELAIAEKSVTALKRSHGSHFKPGSIAEVIGLLTGSTLDWVKSSFKLPLVYIYELRDTGNHGFLLPPDQIIPSGQEVLDSLVTLFREAKKLGYPKY